MYGGKKTDKFFTIFMLERALKDSNNTDNFIEFRKANEKLLHIHSQLTFITP